MKGNVLLMFKSSLISLNVVDASNEEKNIFYEMFLSAMRAIETGYFFINKL